MDGRASRWHHNNKSNNEHGHRDDTQRAVWIFPVNNKPITTTVYVSRRRKGGIGGIRGGVERRKGKKELLWVLGKVIIRVQGYGRGGNIQRANKTGPHISLRGLGEAATRPVIKVVTETNRRVNTSEALGAADTTRECNVVVGRLLQVCELWLAHKE